MHNHLRENYRPISTCFLILIAVLINFGSTCSTYECMSHCSIYINLLRNILFSIQIHSQSQLKFVTDQQFSNHCLSLRQQFLHDLINVTSLTFCSECRRDFHCERTMIVISDEMILENLHISCKNKHWQRQATMPIFS